MYRFSYRVYRRPFRRPLRTHHGWWEYREGIVLRLEEETGRSRWGEIAPVPELGSETLEEALSFCRRLGSPITGEMILSIPERLPACRFAFESALEDGSPLPPVEGDLPSFSYLLPAGAGALDILPRIRDTTSIDTFKWKIGVAPLETELALGERLSRMLPPGGKLRLDANGGLDIVGARAWLTLADRASAIEFLEQPLPPERFREMLTLADSFRTPLALDESVATVKQVEYCYREGWRGIYALKPSIMGSIRAFRELWSRSTLDVVFSSALETTVGRAAALRLAAGYARGGRALGFGVGHWFADTMDRETSWLETLWKTS